MNALIKIKMSNYYCKIDTRRHYVYIATLLLIQCLIVLSVNAQRQEVDSSFHIYLLMGQSNMSGRGYLTKKFRKEHHKRVFVLNKKGNWAIAHHPLHYDKPKITGVGPGLAFGIRMARWDKKARIGLVPCAVGGTPIEHWRPGAYDKATHTHPFDDALKRIRQAMKTGVIFGVIWHQGEADSDPEKAKKYMHQLSALILRIRQITHNPRLPFVAGEVGRFYRRQININPVLDELPDSISFTGVASSLGLTDRGDNIHFSSRSAEKLGQRYASQMISLQKGRND